MSQQWFLFSNNAIVGPLTATQLQDMAIRGILSPFTPVSLDRSIWVNAGQINGLEFSPVSQNIPPAPEVPSVQIRTTQRKIAAKRQRIRTTYVLYGLVLLLVLFGTMFFVSKRRGDHAGKEELATRIPNTPSADVELTSPVRVLHVGTQRASTSDEALPTASEHALSSTSPQSSPRVATTPATTPITKVQVHDLLAEATAAGFEDSSEIIQSYVQFGNAALATQVATGDQFDRIEVERKTNAHRESILNNVYFVHGFRIQIPRQGNYDDKGFVVECPLPFRLTERSRASLYDGCSGAVSSVYFASANLFDAWYLTKDETLRACRSVHDILAVRKNDGLLYFGESSTTTLRFVILNFDVARHISRNQTDYTVDLVVERLRWGKPLGEWGFYQEMALIKHDWNCEAVRYWNYSGEVLNVMAPEYFRPTIDPDRLPRLICGDLVKAELIDGSGDVVGSYSRPTLDRELILPPKAPHPRQVVKKRGNRAIDRRSGGSIPEVIEALGPYTGNWRCADGAMFELSDDGSEVTIKLKSGGMGMKSLEGVLKRTGSKWKEWDVLTGTLNVVYEDDPLTDGGRLNVRKLPVKRTIVSDDGNLRLFTEKVYWSRTGKEVKRQAETVDLIREK